MSKEKKDSENKTHEKVERAENELPISSKKDNKGEYFNSLDRYKYIIEKISQKANDIKLLASGRAIPRAVELLTSRDLKDKFEGKATIEWKFETKELPNRKDKTKLEPVEICSAFITSKFKK